MTGRLDGVTSLVTGGASGIGRAVVEAYLEEGADVVVLDRDEQGCSELAAGDAAHLELLRGDATDAGDLARAVEAAGRRWGRLNQVTCCVGLHDQRAVLEGMTPGELRAAFEEVFAANVLSTLLTVCVARERLVAEGGSLTLTLSEAAFHASGGGILYGSSKWAARGAVEYLARELAPRVRVNAVSPGGTVGTRLSGLASLGQRARADEIEGREERISAATLLGVAATPLDHAAAYVYLAAPTLARVVTGAVLCTDGGRR